MGNDTWEKQNENEMKMTNENDRYITLHLLSGYDQTDKIIINAI